MPRFKPNDEVVYISGKHGNSWKNPLWDYVSKPVIGKIVNFVKQDDPFSSFYNVAWCNGSNNTYTEDDLELYEDPLMLPVLPVPNINDFLGA